jgi:hypothetical protein
VPEDGGLINQALIGLKPVNACVHTYTKPQTSSTRSRGLGWRIHESVEDTKLSTNKQHSLSLSRPSSVSVVLLASKAAWQLAWVKRSASLASISRHTLPRRASAACRCRVCVATQGTPKTFVVKEAERSLGDGGGRGVIFFEVANKLVLIEAAIGRRPCLPQRRCWCVPCTE